MMLKVVSTGSRDGNCYVLKAGGEMLLLDCGCRARDIMRGIGFFPSGVAGCLVTHEHSDHVKAVRQVAGKGIPCYGSRETAEAVGAWIRAVPEGVTFKAGGFFVTAFSVPHDGTPCFGYVVEHPEGKFLYATDYEHIPYTFARWKINHFLVECNHTEALMDSSDPKYAHSLRGHSSTKVVREFIQASGTAAMCNVVLCHLSDGWADAGEMYREIKGVAGEAGVYIAEKGKDIQLRMYPWEGKDDVTGGHRQGGAGFSVYRGEGGVPFHRQEERCG